jgi:predicted flap endonuclease-1-like 5' DNA nuclease
LAAAKAAGISVKGADDLEVIEGIGPKICGLFHAAGQKTFTQVSQMSIQQMSKILDDAGPRFKLANPETWAQQAGLAANNRWAELKTLQDNLTAGVTMQQDRSEL